jgi:PAS domain S-box-containing protein
MRRVPLRGWPGYGFAVGAIVVATILRLVLDPITGDRAPYITYFAASIVVFLVADIGPAVLELALGGLVGAYLFVTPRGSLALEPGGRVLLSLYFLVGGATLALLRSLRKARRLAEQRQEDLLAAEAARLAQHETWRATLASIADALIATDRDGLVTFLNGVAERLTGISADGATGRPLAEVLPLAGQRADPTAEALDRVLRRGEVFAPVDDLVLADRTGSGQEIPVGLVASPIRDGAGTVLGVVLVVRGLAESKRAARELGEAKEAAEAANRAKDRFLAALSHELRTPLTPVLLGVTYLLEGDESPASLRPIFEMIRRNVDLEARLIDDLLDVVQIRRGALSCTPRLVDAHASILQAVDSCRDELDAAAIVPLVSLDAATHHVLADPVRFRQSVANLLKNAVKFSPRGGRVAIRTHVEPRGDGDLEARDLFVVEVSDHGIGIAPEALATIFDAFEQGLTPTAPRRGGLGLGLAICRAIVAASGGTIEATSPGPGLGATFRLRVDALPAPPAALEPPRRVDVPGPFALTAPLRILLVEDDEPTCRAVAQVVRSLGHEVITADSVASAVALDDDRIDLVISDIGLPDGTGHDLLRLLLSRRPIKAIALSGFGLDDDIRQSRAVGFSEHLTKPVDLRTLETAIRRVSGAA